MPSFFIFCAKKEVNEMIESSSIDFEALDEIYQNKVVCKAITKGWSSDEKYYIKTKRQQYLIRVSNDTTYKRKRDVLCEMQKLEKTNLRFSRAYEVRTYRNKTYMSHEWIRGVDLSDYIDSYSKQQQYDLGYEAGQFLKTIHSINMIESYHMSWEEHFNQKLDVKIQKYLDCPIHYKHGQTFINYINSHRHLLKGRDVVFQHGDYHTGNMMLNDQGKLVIIDFDRTDYGDGWEEFNRIVWCKKHSIPFAVAMINGYFNDDVPETFWKLMKLYIFQNSLGSIYWSIPYGQQQVDIMIKQSNDIALWYEKESDYIPMWYRNYY